MRVAKRTIPLLLTGTLLSLLAAVPAHAAFPGTNGKILYQTDGKWDTEIQSINPDGTGRVNLTMNSAIDDRDAAWSPDGEKIAYVSGVSTRVSNDPVGDQLDLYVMNADGSGVARLTETQDLNERQPAWSPDGTKIAFTGSEEHRKDPGNVYSYEETYDVYTINADGTGKTRLTDGAGDNYDPAWSPDGDTIAFASSRDAASFSTSAEIYAMQAAPEGPSNGPLRLTDTRSSNHSPDWSPDGSKIVFVSGRDRPRSHYFVGEIYSMNANGSRETRLTTKGGYRDPDWSPDGRRLAFSNTGIYTMKAAPLGGKNRPQFVVSPKYGTDNPDWQPIP